VEVTSPVSDKDGDQSTSGADDVDGADQAGLAEFRGATEDDLGRDARENGTKTPRVGRRGAPCFVIFTRDSMRVYATPIPSVRLSVTRVYCIKTA